MKNSTKNSRLCWFFRWKRGILLVPATCDVSGSHRGSGLVHQHQSRLRSSSSAGLLLRPDKACRGSPVPASETRQETGGQKDPPPLSLTDNSCLLDGKRSPLLLRSNQNRRKTEEEEAEEEHQSELGKKRETSATSKAAHELRP